jgi:copper chaperone CopZ
MTTTETYVVTGMTCGHCVSAVSGELSKLPEVVDVAVDLETGQVTVASDSPLDPAAVRDAVEEAGYQVLIR